MLGLTITDALFHRHPDRSEGFGQPRASVVNTQALADVARRLCVEGLGVHVLLGRGGEHWRGRQVQHSGRRYGIAGWARSTCNTVLEKAREVSCCLACCWTPRRPWVRIGLKTSLQEPTAARGLVRRHTWSPPPARPR